MPRKKRTLDRDGGVVRDASLLVIASEDTYAVKQYFERFRTRRVQFLVLHTDHGRSSPEGVLARLDEFKREYATEPDDQFWLCLDKDHWAEANHIQNLRLVLQLCRQKGYRSVVSNPCFELWLLLHFQSHSTVGPNATCLEICSQLAQIAGGYNKRNCDRLAIEPPMVHEAISRARALEINTDEAPDRPATRVYQIVEELIQREAIELALAVRPPK